MRSTPPCRVRELRIERSRNHSLTNDDVIDRQKVLQALEAKRDQFREYHEDQKRQRDLVWDLFAHFASLDRQTILDRIAQRDIAWPGALPTHEIDEATDLRMTFTPRWETHEEARTWALGVLRDQPVIAVDGSQVTPTKDFSIPVGAVQIGWFINYHRPGGLYIKDVDFEVLGPAELEGAEDDSDSIGSFPNWLVNQKRFVGECRQLCRLMTEHASLPEHQRPVCFLDGSLVISFAGQMRRERAKPYIDAVTELLACSERHRVPLVAYVDTSYSRDLVTLVQVLTNATGVSTLSDAGMLGNTLSQWGDRSPFFLCARRDELSKDGRAEFYNDIAFTYLRVVQGRSPARVEIPRWLVEIGPVEAVMDIVRAECVVGAGYPYAVETADAVAVLTQQDRQRFYALWQQFLAGENVTLTQARKAGSKLGRR
jgi:hypothetical protein